MPNSLNVSITPSRYLLVLFASIAMLACVCVWCSGLPPVLKLAMTVGIAAITGLSLRQHYLLRASRSIYALRYRDQQWYLQLRGGEIAATLLPTSTLTHSLLVLNFRIDNSDKKTNLILLPDSVSADSLRTLKSTLRFNSAV